MGQLVCTRNGACALSPLLWPTARMVWVPGWAEAGTVIFLAKVPVLLVVTLPTRIVSKESLTVSLTPKWLPLTFTAVVGGPTVGESVIAGLAANAVGLPAARKAFPPEDILSAKTRAKRTALRVDVIRMMDLHF